VHIDLLICCGDFQAVRVLQWHGKVDTFVSQDWPQGIAKHVAQQEVEQLLKRKRHFREEIADDTL